MPTMYIRKKTIKGKEYYYLVRSVREGKNVRQAFLAYLGTEKPDKKELKKIGVKYGKNKP